MDNISKAKGYALRLLTLRQRSIGELELKMQQKGYDEIIIKQVLVYLKEYRLVDDDKYATQLVESMLNKSRPIGKLRIKQELKKRHISAEIIDKATSTIDDANELARAQDLVNKTLSRANRNYTWQMLARLLQRRGFSYDTIRGILADLDEI